jgi:hypothetical protein
VYGAAEAAPFQIRENKGTARAPFQINKIVLDGSIMLRCSGCESQVVPISLRFSTGASCVAMTWFISLNDDSRRLSGNEFLFA